jgi:hypothetical protein
MAAALLLTTVAGFIITSYGINSGLFGGRTEGAAKPAPSQAARVAATASPAPQDPRIVEQVVYRDEYVQAPPAAPTSPSNPAPAPQAATSAGGGASPPDTPAVPAPPPATAPLPNAEAVDVDGRVGSVSSGSFTVTGTRLGTIVLAVNSDTEWEGGSLSTIQPGTRVEAKILVAGGNSPTGPGGSFIAVDVHAEDGD